jgi:hypothetical protein
MLSVRIINGVDVCEVTDQEGCTMGSDAYHVVEVVRRCLLGLGFHPDTVNAYLKGDDDGENG